MTNREIKQKVRKFQKEFGSSPVDYAYLQKAAEKQGYTVIEFNNVSNDPNVRSLVEALKLSDKILYSKGFAYTDRNFRLVFVHEDLSENEKVFVLAHEVGHIYLGHLAAQPLIGKDVREEYEANEFSHFLLNQTGTSKLMAQIRRHKKAVICIASVVILIAAGIFVTSRMNANSQYYGEYYLTATGSKYHQKDCIFVKGKTNIHRMTADEFYSGEYEPCKTCLP